LSQSSAGLGLRFHDGLAFLASNRTCSGRGSGKLSPGHHPRPAPVYTAAVDVYTDVRVNGSGEALTIGRRDMRGASDGGRQADTFGGSVDF
jgi:hypothetical protein